MGFRNLPEMKPTNKPQFAGVGFDFGGGETEHPVTSVNGETGAVVLDAADVGALPSDTSIPTKTSDLENDSGFVDSDIIAPVETTSTASQAYTVGQYFINSLGQLCRVTVDIASGGTITVGTNCVVEPVGAALTSLNSKSGGLPAVQEGTITADPSAPLTVHGAWTHLRYRPGVIAEFSFNFTLTSSISGWTKIASLGFPISTINAEDVFAPVYNGGNTQPISYAQIKQNGDIYLYTTTSGTNISIACTLMLD